MKPAIFILLIFSFKVGFGQQSLEFDTQIESSLVIGNLFNYGDSLLCLSQTSSGIAGAKWDKIEARLIDKQSLATLDTFVVWEREGRQFSNLPRIDFVNHPFLGKLMIDIWHEQNSYIDGNLELVMLGSDFVEDSVLFELNKPNRYVKCSQIIDDTLLYVLSTRSNNFFEDSTYVDVYDLQGNLRFQREYTLFELYGGRKLTINQHPIFDSVIALFDIDYLDIVLLDKYSLDTLNAIKFDRSKNEFRHYGSFSNMRHSHIDTSGFTMYGTSNMLHGIDSLNTDIDDQAYYFKRDWNGDSIIIENFGPHLVFNDMTAVYYDEYSNTHYMAGRLPTDLIGVTNPIAREMIIYRSNHFGYDSLVLFGNKNHFPQNIVVDGNGDFFIFSCYTDSWFDNKTYGVVTKIPNYAFQLAEKEKISRNISFYPNPTKDVIKIQGEWKKHATYSIYSTTGALLQKGNLLSKEINVSSFPSGNYILNIEQGSNKRISTVFQKL